MIRRHCRNLLKTMSIFKFLYVNSLQELNLTRVRLEENVHERESLASKCTSYENKVIEMQHELNKKERDNYNQIVAENTEKHLSNLCQTLTGQMEDMKVQLKLSDEKCRRLEAEQNTKYDKFEAQAGQIENLKKELEMGNESYERMKRSMEDLMNNHRAKEKVN